MAKVKKKLTPAQKKAKRAAKEERQKKYQWVFMNGRQVRIKRPPMVDGMSVDEFIMRNADPIWLHQNEMWELIPVEEPYFCIESEAGSDVEPDTEQSEDIPF
jgi:hypothetical protein